MTQQEKDNQRFIFHRFQKKREKEFAPVIFKALNSQVKEFIHYYKAGLREDYALMHVHSAAIVKALKPLYIDAGVTYGAKVRAHITRQRNQKPIEQKGMAIGFNQRMIDLMTAYFQTDILNVSEGITETTRNIIKAVLQQAINNAKGIEWIVQQLENTEISRIRSRTIARTETVTAANQGAIFAAKDTGLLLNKEWLAVKDNRTRHDHRFVDGQKVGMEDEFSLPGGIKMSQPGDRTQDNGLPTPAKEIINCRCSVVFEALRDSRGRPLFA